MEIIRVSFRENHVLVSRKHFKKSPLVELQIECSYSLTMHRTMTDKNKSEAISVTDSRVQKFVRYFEDGKKV
jgi:hypothetical protein